MREGAPSRWSPPTRSATCDASLARRAAPECTTSRGSRPSDSRDCRSLMVVNVEQPPKSPCTGAPSRCDSSMRYATCDEPLSATIGSDKRDGLVQSLITLPQSGQPQDLAVVNEPRRDALTHDTTRIWCSDGGTAAGTASGRPPMRLQVVALVLSKLALLSGRINTSERPHVLAPNRASDHRVRSTHKHEHTVRTQTRCTHDTGLQCCCVPACSRASQHPLLCPWCPIGGWGTGTPHP